MTTIVPSGLTDDSARDSAHGSGAPALLLLLAAVVLAGCAGGARAPVRTAPVASLSDAVECAREQGKKMGFQVVRRDPEEHRLVLERTNRDVERSDPSFQRAVEQLELEPGSGEVGSDRPLEITARTFHEYWTRKGRTRRQQAASEQIRAAADTLLQRCVDGTASGSGTGR